ncbi:hypothetical protein ACFWHF_11985 [Streptomyces griseoincarnatus]
MAFPQTPLEVLIELMVGGVWTDITSDVYTQDKIVISRGRPDESKRTDPGKCTMVLNNRLGKYSPRNPRSPYYTLIGRNTPIRVSVPGSESYLDLDGTSGAASTPDDPALDITGNLDIRWEGEADWYAPGSQFLIGKWGAAGQRSYHLRIQDGYLVLHAATNGTTGYFAGRLLPALPRRAALRATLTTGVGGWTFRMYWAETMDGPWTQCETDYAAPEAGSATIWAGTAPLQITPDEQPDATPPRRPVTGRCYRAEVRSGIDGTVVAGPDFTTVAAGTTNFTDSAGRTWTVPAGVTDRNIRFTGEVSSWPSRWDVSGKDVRVPIEAAGILRRLGQGTKALDSTLRRRIPAGQPLAYWPMEDGQAATQAASALDGGQSLKVTGLQFASESSLPSSQALPVLGDQSSLSGAVPGAATGGWHVEMVYKLDALPAAEQTMISVLLNPGTGGIREVRARVSSAAIKVEALDRDGAVVVWFQNTTGLGDFIGEWNRLQLFSSVNGAQTNVSLAWRDVVTGLWWVIYTPYTGTPGTITTVRGTWGTDFQGMAIGHLAAFDIGGSAPAAPGVTIYEGSDEGFAGETAGRRMTRLATEENVPLSQLDEPSRQAQVGPQRPDTLLTLLESAADVDGGILYERRDRIALAYRDRISLYNQPVALALDYAAPGRAPAADLEPVDDDQETRNDFTVAREGGASARAVLEDGVLSVQDPPNGVGRYDESVTLNLHEDSQAEPTAYWRLHLGTHDGARYPVVHVDLAAAPDLVDEVTGLESGDRVQIANPPVWLPPGPIDLLMQGYQEVIGHPVDWDFQLNCTPAEPWTVGVVEDPVYGKVDTDGSELLFAVDEDDTTLTVAATDGPEWVTAWPSLTANPDFATDLTGWSAFGATIERVPAPPPAPFAGAWALKLTPDGVAEFPNAGSGQVAVTVGSQYTLSGWLRCATARSVALNINWFGAGSSYLTTDANDVPVQANTWTWFEMTATAPVGAQTANAAPTVADFPPSTDVLWAHHLTLRRAGGMPREFPIGIRAGGETMTATAITDSRSDTFGRTVAGGWGTADSGQAWTVVGTAADYSVGAGYAVAAQPTVSVTHLTLLPSPGPDVDLYTDVASSTLAAGGSLFTGPMVRAADNNNHYQARIEFTTAAGVVLTLRKRVAGAETVLGTYTSTLTHVAGTWYRVRLQAFGSRLRAKVWLASGAEPRRWHITVTDTSLTAAASVGTRAYRNTGNTNTGAELRFDNVRVANPQIFTVERSVNGVVKTHGAGTAVRLANPAVVAL